ncbi:MAG: insulinase family protein [Bradyrhizobiaceae bacterium]|nr:insulinase family protein [Bradyrhizobiaceae bacterium]
MTVGLVFLRRSLIPIATVFAFALSFATSASATTAIERVVSPSGIEVWLVREPAVPLVALDFSFRGGANQDPADKPGVATMISTLLDEGAGDLEAKTYHERLENKAIELGFQADRDYFSGSVRTLVENIDEAAELVRLALTSPRFDSEAVERMRGQLLSNLRHQAENPSQIASREWWATAFAGHPYGRPVNGTIESMSAINPDDLRAYTRRVFARDMLKVAIVGNIDAAKASEIVEKVFASLPAKSDLLPVASAEPQGLGRVITVNLDVPQSVVVIGGAGIPRNDPDFMAAFILNHILGGGAFSSRLYHEVREERGLAYSVYSTLVPLSHAALFMGSTATRADRATQTLDVVEREIHRLAETGPTADELAKAKTFLEGSFALRFDTSTKIASQLVAMQLDDLGIDYIERRNSLVEAVTLADVKRVAKRLLDGGLLVTVVGRTPQGIASKNDGG